MDHYNPPDSYQVRAETQLVSFNGQVRRRLGSLDRALPRVSRQLSLEGQGLEGVEGRLGAAFGSGERKAGVLVRVCRLEHLETFFVAGNGGNGSWNRGEGFGSAISAFISLKNKFTI